MGGWPEGVTRPSTHIPVVAQPRGLPGTGGQEQLCWPHFLFESGISLCDSKKRLLESEH